MPTHDRLPEEWRRTSRHPRLPDAELGVAEDGDHVVFFDWPEMDAYVRAPRECCIDLGGDGSME